MWDWCACENSVIIEVYFIQAKKKRQNSRLLEMYCRRFAAMSQWQDRLLQILHIIYVFVSFMKRGWSTFNIFFIFGQKVNIASIIMILFRYGKTKRVGRFTHSTHQDRHIFSTDVLWGWLFFMNSAWHSEGSAKNARPGQPPFLCWYVKQRAILCRTTWTPGVGHMAPCDILLRILNFIMDVTLSVRKKSAESD